MLNIIYLPVPGMCHAPQYICTPQPGIQSRPQVAQSILAFPPSHAPAMHSLSAHTTCRAASWRSPYTYSTCLDSRKTVKSTCTHECVSTDSVLAVPVYLGLADGPSQRLCLQGWNKPWPTMDYRLSYYYHNRLNITIGTVSDTISMQQLATILCRHEAFTP